ncbi:MAG: 50S ribosomal protein L10 [Nitrososphaerota archaeon]
MVRAALLMRPKELKAKRVEELKNLFQAYRVIGLIDLFKSSADLIHTFRSKFRGRAVVKVAKKTLAMKAAREAGRDRIAEYLEREKKPIALIFTNINPFVLKLELDKGRILTPPRPGDVADMDVVVPPINTGLQPGPILSEFGKLKIPTRIEGGTIWIAKETTVARKGDVIQPALASLLAKLEIGAVYRSINLSVAFDGDMMIPAELLTIDVEGARKMLSEAHSLSLVFAIELGYATPETIVPMLVRAYLAAISLSIATSYPTKDNIGHLLAKAASEAATLQKVVDSRSAS